MRAFWVAVRVVWKVAAISLPQISYTLSNVQPQTLETEYLLVFTPSRLISENAGGAIIFADDGAQVLILLIGF